jgi:hypothetical protein
VIAHLILGPPQLRVRSSTRRAKWYVPVVAMDSRDGRVPVRGDWHRGSGDTRGGQPLAQPQASGSPASPAVTTVEETEAPNLDGHLERVTSCDLQLFRRGR